MTAPTNEFSNAFSSAFDAENAAVNDYCWPVDTSCCQASWDGYDPETQALAISYAAMTLRMLTAFQVGGCPITVRPCRKPCGGGARTYVVAPVGGPASTGAMTPVNLGNGSWINMVCGCTGTQCSCGPLCEVDLPTPVGEVTEVTVDGFVIDPTAYRVDNGHLLVRQDGDCWPTCQDLGKPVGEEGTFSVTYLNGYPVDAIGASAAGRLACEFAKACTGGKCALPDNVVRVVRQGIAMDLATDVWPGGMTGIRQVDMYVRRYNPYGLATASTVYSPDMRYPRQTTWSST